MSDSAVQGSAALVAVRRDDLQALVWHADDNWADEPEGVQVLQRVEAALTERTTGAARERVATPALGQLFDVALPVRCHRARRAEGALRRGPSGLVAALALQRLVPAVR